MKKENKCGIRRVLVILLCFMLVTSNTGTVAFAGESAPAQTDAEEVISGTESSESAVESDELTLKNDSAEESAEESFDEGTKEEGTKSEESSVEEPEAEGSAEQEPTAEEFNAEESVEREPTAVESAEEGYETEEPAKEGYEAEGPAKEGYEAEGPAKEEDAAEEPQDVLEESAEALTKTVDASMSEEPAGEQDGNSGVIASGTCGADSDNLTWVLTDDGTMTISGEGAMENYSENSCPWSSYRSSITNVVIPFGITNIGNYAFSDCTNLTSATIPESVTCIGDFAFAGCTSLKTAPITDSVTEIGEKAFTECNSLTSVTIPGSMEKNGGYVFSHCKGLTSAMIETGITNIAAGMFYGCEKMICVMIPDTVTYIRRFAFFGCPLIIDVYYNGTAWQWSRIGIDDIGNDILVYGIEDNSITIHYVSKVPYVENSWNGTAVVSKSRYAFADSVPSDGNMTSGWYYLNSDVTKNGRIESIFGDVRLILGDGNTLDVKGLYVPEGSTLTIYGQTDGSGRIYSHPSGGAGIGGYSGHNNGKIEIHGGTIDATGYDHCAGIGSNDGKTTGDITIYDGTITAIGGSDGAGIGGGLNCSGGNITIYGGTITANGPTDDDCCENGAGIGGGKGGDGGNITIYGGSITTYSRDGAGIGGGDDGDGGNITISGGTITSTKVNQGQGARIGGGCDAAPGTITINGGTITTDGGSGAGIGGGKRNTAGGSVTINGGVISASGSYGIGSGENGSDVAITLNYTDSTRNSISITASSYFGNVTLEQHFQNMDYIFEQSSDPDLGFLAHSALRAWDGRISSWALLRKRINAGGEISLGQDYTAEENDTALTVPPGREVTLDLNGYTLDRDLSDGEAKEDGYVLRNEGKLTITSSSSGQAGTIKGGNNTGNGGGIYNTGTLEIQNGTITGNSSSKDGGGIYNTGTLLFERGSVSGNTAELSGGGIRNYGGTVTIDGQAVIADNTAQRNHGGGICVSESSSALNLYGGAITRNTAGGQGGGIMADGTVHVEGYPKVTENHAAEGQNIYLCSGKKLLFTQEQNPSYYGNLGIYMADRTGVFTQDYYLSALETSMVETYFTADPGYEVYLKDGEAALRKVGVTIKGATGSFNEKIKLNYYFDFPDEVLADDGAYVTLTNKDTETTITLPVKEADEVKGKGHRFSIPLAAKAAGETITARVYDGQNNALTVVSGSTGKDYTETGVQCSLMQYFDWLAGSGETDKEKAVGAAAKDYCTAAQIYFNYNADGLSVSGAVDSVTAETLSNYIAGRSGELPSGVSVKGISAMLESDNTLRLYLGFTGVNSGDFTFEIDGEAVKLKQRDSDHMCYLALDEGVWPNHLQKAHKYTISDGENTYAITASVLTYARSCAIRDSKKYKKECDLGKALYLYNKAAIAAFGE